MRVRQDTNGVVLPYCESLKMIMTTMTQRIAPLNSIRGIPFCTSKLLF